MENIKFDRLLLKTAFCCMACDGDIDSREVESIRAICAASTLFPNLDPVVELNELVSQLNADGKKFLQNYLNQLEKTELTEAQQLDIIHFAIETIKADEEIEYSEIKFFKAMRACLKIKNEVILEQFPELETYLEADIRTSSNLNRLINQYFDSVELPQFAAIPNLGAT